MKRRLYEWLASTHLLNFPSVPAPAIIQLQLCETLEAQS